MMVRGTRGLQDVLRVLGLAAGLVLCGLVGCDGQGCRSGTAFVDSDGDGADDDADNCPDDANEDQADADDDGVGNACDNCPDDANDDQADGDGDGVGDVCDNSPDDPNPGQGDADNDGIGNVSDNCRDIPNTDQADRDNDGPGDVCDNCPGTANEDQADADENGVGDACEGDVDGDGVSDAEDNCLAANNPEQTDTDGDGVGDACDNSPLPNPDQDDTDGDGVGDASDNCPDEANAGQADGDGDEVGDDCDNCPADANADQADTDDDGVGDACQGDQDGDGEPDGTDNCRTEANADQSDDDGDGVGDVCDNCPDDTNFNQADAENDDVGDACDNCPTTANTNQTNTDTDARGNACDNCPLVSNPNQENTDGDACGNACESACDTGGGPPPQQNSVQVNAGSDRTVCPGSTVVLDATSTTPGAAITWSQVGVPSVGVTNAPDPATFTAPGSGTSGAVFNLRFDATGTAGGFNPGTDTVQITTRPLDTSANGVCVGGTNAGGACQTEAQCPSGECPTVETKHSGAAQPTDRVDMDLADSEDRGVCVGGTNDGGPCDDDADCTGGDCDPIFPIWVQDADDALRVNLSRRCVGGTNNDALCDSNTDCPGGECDRAASFDAPQVTATTNLRFVAVMNCVDGAAGVVRAGRLTVPIQVATIELTLPASVEEGQTLNLYTVTRVNGDTCLADQTCGGVSLAERGLEVLFFAAEPGNGGLPPGVEVSLVRRCDGGPNDGLTCQTDAACGGSSCEQTGELAVTSGAGETIEIIARLFGTAGELANNEGDGDTLDIVAAGN
jgi:hypothetical protein